MRRVLVILKNVCEDRWSVLPLARPPPGLLSRMLSLAVAEE
jgi:hypothetical protein